MKLLRITVLIIFALSTIGFTWFTGYEADKLDTTGPEIFFGEDSITVSVNATEEELLADVTAMDQVDKDVTNSVMIEKISKLVLGKRIISYAAFDSSNNITKKERTLSYSDYTPPRFTLVKPFIFYVGEYDNMLNNVSVRDSIDTDLEDKIKYEMPDYYFSDVEGVYEVRFQVTNSIGDTAVLPVKVEFRYPDLESKEKVPEILLWEYLIYLKVGDTCNPLDYIEKVRIGQRDYSLQEIQVNTVSGSALSVNAVTVRSDLNLKEPGCYEVNYSMKTSEGYQGATRLLVIVEE